MMWLKNLLAVILVISCLTICVIRCDFDSKIERRNDHGKPNENYGPFFLKASKSIPRIGRTNDESIDIYYKQNVKRANNENEESKKNYQEVQLRKFLMQASKSVPRLGRSNVEMPKYEEDYDLPYYTIHFPDGSVGDKKYITWSNIAEAFEYNPELLTSPGTLSRLEKYLASNPVFMSEWNKERFKRMV